VLADAVPDCVGSAFDAVCVPLAEALALTVAAESVALVERDARALAETRATVALTVEVRAPEGLRLAVVLEDADGAVDAEADSLGLADELGQPDSESVPLGDGVADAECVDVTVRAAL
jgi:hypothetical protein